MSNTLFCACVSVLFVFIFCTSYMLPVSRCSFLIATLIFFVYSLTGGRNKWDTRAWHSSDTWHPFSSLPSEGEFCLIFYFVFSDRGKYIFLLSMTWAWCESLMSKWFRVCLSFLDLQILITPLVSSNSSSENNNYTSSSILNLLCSVVGHAEFPIRQSNDYSYTVWIHSSLYILIKII